MTPRARHHSLTWRVNRAIEHASVQRPLLTRTGPAWAFGIMGVGAELFLAPLVLAITFGVGLLSYLLLDTPGTRIRVQQRPRFVSIRLLYLNTLIVAGFWLAVMFVFSAADPAVSNGVEQRLPALLDVAAATDLKALVSMNRATQPQVAAAAAGMTSTWFDVFVHGLVCTISLNLLLYGMVVARRRRRSHHVRRSRSRRPLRYDPRLGMFIDEEPSSAG
ncbi:hypothetical protein BH09GEM1_BH09GEM1_18730 [soil metagenome]